MNEWVSRLKDPLWAKHNDALTKPSHSEILNPMDTEKTLYTSERNKALTKYQDHWQRTILEHYSRTVLLKVCGEGLYFVSSLSLTISFIK